MADMFIGSFRHSRALSSRTGFGGCRPRPTHFLALQLSQHAEVCQAIARVQAALVKHDSLLEATLVSLCHLPAADPLC